MSFKLKTILLILSVSLIPYALIMFFVGNALKDEYAKRTLIEMQTQLQLSVNRMEQYLNRLQEDMEFMSSMDVMNDIYSNDLDKRISNLFEEKKKALHLEGEFYLLNEGQTIVASSDMNSLGVQSDKKAFMSQDVFSTFTAKKIGTLILDFSLKNLTYFFSNAPSRNYYIIAHEKEILYRQSEFENPLEVQVTLQSYPYLKIVLQEDKAVMQGLLVEYEQWFFLTLIIGALLISLIALYFANRLIKPVIELSLAADEVTKNQNYEYQVKVSANDEIGRLSHSFNMMIKSMSDALEALKLESENRIKLTQEKSKNEMLQELSKNLSKYLSPQVYQSIFSGEQSVTLSSKRKKLTVFFSDIVDFTDTTDTMESEDLSALLNDYLNEMTLIALKHGATIDKYIGDSIMLFFGDPKSSGIQEDAVACVEMAIEMQEYMHILHEKWKAIGITKPFKVRMGIHTGYCTVGNFGSDDRLEYTIIGSTVNLASRIESASAPGEIYISEETQLLVQHKFETLEKTQITPKGFMRSIKLFSVRSQKEESSKVLFNEEGISLAYEPNLASKDGKKALKEKIKTILDSLE
jgi:class 3 adenylate cyclase/HAMP domain-containing protein